MSFNYYNKSNKYGNKKITYKGITFDSQKEFFRYKVLLNMEQKGLISDLKLQVPFELIPSQYKVINGKKKCIEKACVYYADFVYTNIENGEMIVEDAKGKRTDVYIIKKKLMLYKYGIEILET